MSHPSDPNAPRFTVRGPAAPLVGDATVPGDKSIGHRAVLFSAIAAGPARVTGLSGGEDNRRTIAAFAALGVPMKEDGPGALRVEGVGLDGLRAAAGAIDCGNSGTTMRLLAGLLAGQPFASKLDGDPYLVLRPMRRVAEPLRQMGGRVEGRSGESIGKKPGEIYPPLDVGGLGAGVRLRGADLQSKVASAQVKSAVILAALGADGPTTVREPARSRDHTERMLSAMGAPLTVAADGLSVTVDPRGWDRRLAPKDFVVPGDLSSSAFLVGAALLVPGSRLVVRGVGVNPTRTGFLDAVRAMAGEGAVTLENEREVGGEPVADIVVKHAPLRGVRIAGELAVRAIDELPLLGALAAHADGETAVSDAEELRVKESDRVAATVALIRALGGDADERPDGFVVRGRPGALRPGTVVSHGDHRIAMAGAVCALAIRGETTVLDVANVATSFPQFAPTLARLGAPLD
jgi:3-phosphoshikimate 1-carboxyvinyltransferase